MRLSIEEQQFFKQTIREYIKNTSIYVFGSRADNEKKGGDKDILIVGDRKLTTLEKQQIIISYWKKFGEQKIDLVTFTPQDNDPFFHYIYDTAVEII